MFQSMFLCAGLGTRLRPLTCELPKPLVPIGDRPMLAHLLSHLRACGGTLRAVNTHHRPEKILSFMNGYDAAVTVSHEPSLLGTAGGVARVKDCFDASPVVVWNGDILARPDLRGLVAATEKCSVVLAVAPRQVGEGTCGLDSEGRVVRLRGQRFGVESLGADYLGVFAIRRDSLDELPEHGCFVGDYLLPRLASGLAVFSHLESGGFSDIGTKEAYFVENLRWLRERQPEQGAWAHPSAIVQPSIALRETIVGEGATVTGEGCLERVIVWPGATAMAPLRDAIVTAHSGVVPVEASIVGPQLKSL